MRGKRDHLIDSLLSRPEFTDYWAYKWSDLLLVNGNKLPEQPMWSYHQWIPRQVELNTPWDEFVRDLLTSTGSTLANGAGNFFVLDDEPTKIAEMVSTAFLGMSIACAKCHNHPMEKWTNDQYFAFANLFSRVRSKNGSVADSASFMPTTRAISSNRSAARPAADAARWRAGLAQSPEDRRLPLAQWLTAPENPYFARAITNRVWKNFFATGLVESVDDLRMTNPSSNEKLLSGAAGFLVTKQFDSRPDARDSAERNISAQQRRAAGEPGRHALLRPLLSAPIDGRGDARCGVASHRRADKLSHGSAQPEEGPRNLSPMGYRALQLPD